MSKKKPKIEGNGKERDLTKERLDKLVPLAREIIEAITEAQLPLGDTHAHDNAKFDFVTSKVLKIMLNNEVKYVDKEFLFQLVFQPFDVIKETVLMSLRKSFDLVIDRSLHKEFREFTLLDMDRTLKAPKEVATGN